MYNKHSLKNNHGVVKPHFVLNLKKSCFCFSKQNKIGGACLKKTKEYFVKYSPFLLNRLLVVFIILINQKFIKNNFVLCKNIVKKSESVSKKISVFIKNSICVFLPQHNLKEQQH